MQHEGLPGSTEACPHVVVNEFGRSSQAGDDVLYKGERNLTWAPQRVG